jgi:hypothetical protein
MAAFAWISVVFDQEIFVGFQARLSVKPLSLLFIVWKQ